MSCACARTASVSAVRITTVSCSSSRSSPTRSLFASTALSGSTNSVWPLCERSWTIPRRRLRASARTGRTVAAWRIVTNRSAKTRCLRCGEVAPGPNTRRRRRSGSRAGPCEGALALSVSARRRRAMPQSVAQLGQAWQRFTRCCDRGRDRLHRTAYAARRGRAIRARARTGAGTGPRAPRLRAGALERRAHVGKPPSSEADLTERWLGGLPP